MLFTPDELARIERGELTVALRRWRRPTVKAGGTLTTAVGVLAIEAVERLGPDGPTAADARAAGYPSADAARAALERRAVGDPYRIAFRLAGPDPRLVLRETVPDAAAVQEVVARLERIDRARRSGPWTTATLRAIAAHPGTRAADLAGLLGRDEVPAFKADVRKLKALGLTVSLEVGYRLSPRGERVLQDL